MHPATRLAGLLRTYLLEVQGDGARVDPAADAVARITSVVPDALAAFESSDVAYVWLTSPNAILNGFVPLHFLVRSDPDAIKVRDVLREIAPAHLN